MSEGSLTRHWQEWHREVKPAIRLKNQAQPQQVDLERPGLLTVPSAVINSQRRAVNPAPSEQMMKMSCVTYFEDVAFQWTCNSKPLESLIAQRNPETMMGRIG